MVMKMPIGSISNFVLG